MSSVLSKPRQNRRQYLLPSIATAVALATALFVISFAVRDYRSQQYVSSRGYIANLFSQVPWGEELVRVYTEQGERTCLPTVNVCRYRAAFQVGTSYYDDGRKNPTWSISELITSEDGSFSPQMNAEFVMKQGSGPDIGTVYSTYVRDDGADGIVDTILSFAVVTFPAPDGQTFPYIPPVGCWSRSGDSPCAIPMLPAEVDGISRMYGDSVMRSMVKFIERRGPST